MKKEYQLDQIDKEIIWVLDENARHSVSRISQLIGCSKQKVSYRLRKMIKLGILNLFSTIINKTKLGYFPCQIYLKFKKTPSCKEVLKKLEKIPSLHWEGLVEGDYDLIIFIMIKSLEECWKVYQTIIDKFSDSLVKKEILLSSTTYHFNHSYLTKAPRKISISEFPHRQTELKQRDLKLINAIKENGRIQINQLAKQIKITPYTIRQRIAYLKRRGVIEGFKIRINDNLIGFCRYIILFSLVEANSYQKKHFLKILIKNKRVHRIIETIGKWDLVCDIVLPKKENPKSWLKKILRKASLKNKTSILKTKEIFKINSVVYS